MRREGGLCAARLGGQKNKGWTAPEGTVQPVFYGAYCLRPLVEGSYAAPNQPMGTSTRKGKIARAKQRMVWEMK